MKMKMKMKGTKTMSNTDDNKQSVQDKMSGALKAVRESEGMSDFHGWARESFPDGFFDNASGPLVGLVQGGIIGTMLDCGVAVDAIKNFMCEIAMVEDGGSLLVNIDAFPPGFAGNDHFEFMTWMQQGVVHLMKTKGVHPDTIKEFLCRMTDVTASLATAKIDPSELH